MKRVTISTTGVSDKVAAPAYGEYVLDITVPGTATFTVQSSPPGGTLRAERAENGTGDAYSYAHSVALLVPGNREYAINVTAHSGDPIIIELNRGI